MLPTIFKRKADLSHYFDNLDNFFSNSFRDLGEMDMSFPRGDVHEDDKNYYVDADLPGLEKKDVSINVENHVLTLSGSREDKREEKKKGYYRLERQTGQFERRFQFGENVDYSKASAEFEKGVLKVVIPKKEKDQSSKFGIEIK